MQPQRLRKILILVHLYAAAIFAPAFVLVAISGGGYLLGNKGAVEKQAVALPEGVRLDPASKTLKTEIEALIASAGLTHRFEYLKIRGNTIITRPTSQPYMEFVLSSPRAGDEALADAGDAEAMISAYQVTPNLQKRMLELHFGHGPKIFRSYQKLVAASLILIVLGGVVVGLLAPSFRRQTALALIGGAGLFFILIGWG